MTLISFVTNNHEAIIQEFEQFARTLMPPDAKMTSAELRDHAEEMLTALAIDMGEIQSPQEQANKSRGDGTVRSMAASGQLHADDRIQHGFSLRAVLAEFRALRAAILHRYEVSGGSDLMQIRRFNEGIDEAMAESMARNARRTDLFRDQFIGVLSHDLRDPLGAITTGAALLAIPEDNAERRTRVAARILSSAQRMQRMIADILDLTQARLGGAIPLTRAPADLAAICDEAILEHRSMHPVQVFQWEARGDLSGLWDADRLSQVVSNLLANAVQHGDGQAITLSATGDAERVSLRVHNGGTPISAEDLPLIFEPLARGADKGPTSSRSLGLGLFIARAIATGHGGTISVESSSEAGTSFLLQLPR